MANRRIAGIGKLGRRLVLAFVMVALAAITINAVISEQSVGADIARVANQQERSLTRAAALTAGAANQGIGWDRADLSPVLDLARRAGAAVRVRDSTGRLIVESKGFRSFPASSQQDRTVIQDGRPVGMVAVRFGSQGLGALARNFEAERWRSRIVAAIIAALLALLVSLIAAWQITRPLDRMLATARSRAAGDRAARVAPVEGVGVIGELLDAFNDSADFIDRQERVRRNLVANVAHELRTPVAILVAGHEAMLDGITEPTAENLRSLQDEVLRLARKVEDLQALAAAEAAVLQMKLVPHDLAVIAEDAAASLYDSYERRGVRLAVRLEQVCVACDRSRMREVIVNLLTNALKFTPAGGTVLLETSRADKSTEKEEATLRVTDTGVGIPAKELPRVTERFFRGHDSARMADGSGLGLTIVSELITAHHGNLKIASDPGQGTQVTVTLPQLPGPADPQVLRAP
jgi:two-component system, OmpR family, sensor histidine kinase BaeS